MTISNTLGLPYVSPARAIEVILVICPLIGVISAWLLVISVSTIKHAISKRQSTHQQNINTDENKKSLIKTKSYNQEKTTQVVIGEQIVTGEKAPETELLDNESIPLAQEVPITTLKSQSTSKKRTPLMSAVIENNPESLGTIFHALHNEKNNLCYACVVKQQYSAPLLLYRPQQKQAKEAKGEQGKQRTKTSTGKPQR